MRLLRPDFAPTLGTADTASYVVTARKLEHVERGFDEHGFDEHLMANRQVFIDFVCQGSSTGPLVLKALRALLDSLMATPEGRAKVARSLVAPTQMELDFRSNKKSMPSIRILKRASLFLSAVPQDERHSEPYLKLQSIYDELIGLKPCTR